MMKLFPLLTFHPDKTSQVTVRKCGFYLQGKVIVLLVTEPWVVWVKESRTILMALSPDVSANPVYVIGTFKVEKLTYQQNMLSTAIIKTFFS